MPLFFFCSSLAPVFLYKKPRLSCQIPHNIKVPQADVSLCDWPLRQQNAVLNGVPSRWYYPCSNCHRCRVICTCILSWQVFIWCFLWRWRWFRQAQPPTTRCLCHSKRCLSLSKAPKALRSRYKSGWRFSLGLKTVIVWFYYFIDSIILFCIFVILSDLLQ